jgi:hypothetical protein
MHESWELARKFTICLGRGKKNMIHQKSKPEAQPIRTGVEATGTPSILAEATVHIFPETIPTKDKFTRR